MFIWLLGQRGSGHRSIIVGAPARLLAVVLLGVALIQVFASDEVAGDTHCDLTVGEIVDVDSPVLDTIQKAIDAAQPGNTVCIPAGSYTENIVVAKQITLTGSEIADDPTTINSGSAGIPVVTVSGTGSPEGGRLEISHVTVTGALGTTNIGAGILVSSPSDQTGLSFTSVTSTGNEGAGIAFNGTPSISDVVMDDVTSSLNGEAGIRIASSILSFNGLTVNNSTISSNGHNGFSFNPSGSNVVGTNFTFTDSTFELNNTKGVVNSHDLSFFGFNGNATLDTVSVTTASGTPAHGGYGVVFLGKTPFTAAGSIRLENVTVNGAVGKGALTFQRYTDLASVVMVDVDVSGTVAPWGQVIVDHTGVTPLDLGTTTTKSIVLWKSGGVDATEVNLLTAAGTPLNRSSLADGFDAEDQIGHAVDLVGLGLVRWKESTLFVTPSSFAAPSSTSASIQRAINISVAGDTVNVEAGVYPEGMVNLDKEGLTLRGAQWGVDAFTRGPSGIPDNETILSNSGRIFDLNAPNITIDGFVFSNLGNRALDSYSYIDGLTIKNTIFVVTSNSSDSGAIQFGGGSGSSGPYTANYFTFERNYLTGTGSGPVLYLGHQMSGGTIKGNVFNSRRLTFGPFGQPDGWVIEGNTFDGNVAGVASIAPGGASGTYVGYGFNAQFGDAVFRNNVVSKMYLGIGQISLVDGQIIGNTFEDNYAGAFQLWGGEYESPVSRDVLIANNLFSYNGTDNTSDDAGFLSQGFRLRPGCDVAEPCSDPTTPNAALIQVFQNRFIDLNQSGGKTQVWAVRNNYPGVVDAEFNYWGSDVVTVLESKVGKGSSDAGSGAGDVFPWISSYTPDPTKVGQPGFWPIDIQSRSLITAGEGDESVSGDPSLGSPSISFGSALAGPISVTFSSIVATPETALLFESPPFNMSTAVLVDISIDGDAEPPYKICLARSDDFDTIWHFEDDAWVNITDAVQGPDGFLCGTTGTLSPFAVAEALPPEPEGPGSRPPSFDFELPLLLPDTR